MGFKLFEALLTSFIPCKLSILFQQLIKRFCNFRKIFDEPLVEASMAKELSYCLDICGGEGGGGGGGGGRRGVVAWK